MIDVSLDRLVERLDAPSRNALVAATGECVTRTHYEVAVEHVLLAMLEQPDLELAGILGAFDIDMPRLVRCLKGSLDALARGNGGRPVFSPFLIEWLGDAWMIASVEHGRTSMGAAALWAAMSVRAERHLDDGVAALVRQAGLTDLRKRLDEFSVASPVERGGPGASNERPAEDALARFCVNFSAEARAGALDPVFGRDDEIRQMVDILGRRRKNNPMVVGEPGVGKTALVEGLALHVAEGGAPAFLRDVQIMGLDLGLLQAGASVKGEFEKRLKDVIAAVDGLSKPVILFFDEAHMLIGAGGAPGGADAANLLKPALARGSFRAIAATTWKEYKKYFEKDAALARRFQLVRLASPTPEQAVTILRGLRGLFEASHGLAIRDEAIEASVELAVQHLAGGELPDKAIDVLDTTAARVRIDRTGEPAELERLKARIESLRRERHALGRDAEALGESPPARLAEIDAALSELARERDALAARWREESALVDRLDAALKAPASEEAENPKPAESQAALRARLATMQGGEPLVPFEVTRDAVARTVSDWTGVPLGALARNEAGGALGFADALAERVRGQPLAVGILDRELRIARAGVGDPDKPRGVFLLVGPSGVGKTETAAAIAEVVFGARQRMIPVNLSEYQEKHTVSRLFGAPPGYVGYGEGGVLTEAVRRRPYSLVLLDEAEKAHPDVLNAFYQVFDKGVMSDGEGREIDFRNTLILLTSNLGAERLAAAASVHRPPAALASNGLAEAAGDGKSINGSPQPPGDLDHQRAEALIDAVRPALTQHFKLALLARMRIVPYLPLSDASLQEIVSMRLSRLASQLDTQHGIELTHDDAVVQGVAVRCARSEAGARDIDAVVNQTLLPRISTEILRSMQQEQRLSRVRMTLRGTDAEAGNVEGIGYDFEW